MAAAVGPRTMSKNNSAWASALQVCDANHYAIILIIAFI